MWKTMRFSNHQAWEHVLEVHPQNKLKDFVKEHKGPFKLTLETKHVL